MAQRKQDAAISEQLKQMAYTLQEHRGDLLDALEELVKRRIRSAANRASRL